MAANNICNPPLPLHSLDAYLQTQKGKELAGATGGIQGAASYNCTIVFSAESAAFSANRI